MSKKIIISVVLGLLFFSLILAAVIFGNDIVKRFDQNSDKEKTLTFNIDQYGVEGDSVVKRVVLELRASDNLKPTINAAKTELTLEGNGLTFFVSTVQEGTFDLYDTNNSFAKVNLPNYGMEVFREESTDDIGKTYIYKNDYSTDKNKCSGSEACGTSWVRFGDASDESSVPLIVSCSISGTIKVDSCDKIIKSINARYL